VSECAGSNTFPLYSLSTSNCNTGIITLTNVSTVLQVLALGRQLRRVRLEKLLGLLILGHLPACLAVRCGVSDRHTCFKKHLDCLCVPVLSTPAGAVHGNEAVLVRLEGGDAMLYQQFCDVGPSLETGSVLLNKTLLSGNDDPSDTEEEDGYTHTMGVYPSCSGMLTSAPAFNRNSTDLVLPDRTALIRGVWPPDPLTFSLLGSAAIILSNEATSLPLQT